MSSTPETRLTSSILKELNALTDTLAIKIHGNEYTRTGEPDVIGTHKGIPFALEIKIEGNNPTPIQIIRLWEWKQAGARIGAVRTIHQALEVVMEGSTRYEPDINAVYKNAFVDTSGRSD